MDEYIVEFHKDEHGIVRYWTERGKLIRCKKCKWWRDPNCDDCKIIEKEKSSGKLLGTEVKQTYIGDLPSDPIELIKSNDEINFENSLNAEAGRYRYRDPQLSYYLERAQWTIAILSEYIEEGNKR